MKIGEFWIDRVGQTATHVSGAVVIFAGLAPRSTRPLRVLSIRNEFMTRHTADEIAARAYMAAKVVTVKK